MEPTNNKHLFYIRSSFLNSYAMNPYFGVCAYYRNLWGIKVSNPIMRQGTKVHEILGYNNRINKETFIPHILHNVDVILEGKPDKLFPQLEELKTRNDGKVTETCIKGAKNQLLSYMYIFNREKGKLKVVDANYPYDTLHEEWVIRNDNELTKILQSFVKTLLNQRVFPKFCPYLKRNHLGYTWMK